MRRLPRGDAGRVAWVVGAAAILALLAVVLVLREITGTPMGDFTRDVFSTAEVPVWTGLLSNAGAFLWVSAIAILAFARVLVHGGEGSPGRWPVALTASAALTAVLAADDFFMLHEWILPRYLGIPERVPMVAYGVAALAHTFVFRREIRAAGPGAWWAALGLLGLSAGMDAVEPEPAPEWRYLAEEGLKILGIGAWLGFMARLSARSLGERCTEIGDGVPSAPGSRREDLASTGR